MEKKPEIDPVILSGNLKDLFPYIRFFPPASDEWPSEWRERTDIYELIRKKNIKYEEKENLVLGMMRNKSDLFTALFPENAVEYWDELEMNIRGGDCQVIRFFINKINKKFLEGFNSVVGGEIKSESTPVIDVAELFDEALFIGKTYLYYDLNDPKIINICEHSPHSIYKTFEYYARKQYVLIRLAREFPIKDLRNKWKVELLEKIEKAELQNEIENESIFKSYMGLKYWYIEKPDFISNFENAYKKLKKKDSDIEYAWEIIKELFINNLKIMQKLRIKENTENEKLRFNKIYNIEKEISKTMESKPQNNYFAPIDFVTLTGKISGQLGHLHKKEINLNNEAFSDYQMFSDHEIHKIKICCKNALKILRENYIDQLEEKEMIEFEECVKGNTYNKIEMLYNKMSESYFRDILKESKEWIEELHGRVSEINISDMRQEDKDGDVQFDFDPEDGNYNDIPEELVIIEDRQKFANILAREFKEDEEKDFIRFIERDGPWPVILNELNRYYNENPENEKNKNKKHKHKDKSLIFKTYKLDAKNAVHQPFSHKIFKALVNYERTELKEGKNG